MSNPRLSILCLTTLYPNRLSPLHGLFVERRLKKIAEHSDVWVAAPVNVGRMPRALWTRLTPRAPAGIPVSHPRYLLPPGVLKQWDGELLYREIAPQIGRLLAARRFDLIDAQYAYPDGFAGMRIARRVRSPYVLTVRGSDLHVLAEDPRRRGVIIETLRGAAGIIAVSGQLGQRALELAGRDLRVRVIPNGIDPSLFRGGSRAESRKRLGWGTSGRIVLAVGRLDRRKGFDLLIDSVAELRDTAVWPVTCHVIGAGPDEQRLRRRIAAQRLTNHVLLDGPLPPAQVALAYAAADVSCLLSETEGSPNVVLESLASGTPVVATRTGDLPQLLAGGAGGIVLERREVGAAARALSAALSRAWDPVAVRGLVEGRTWDDVAWEQRDVYEEILARARRSDKGGVLR